MKYLRWLLLPFSLLYGLVVIIRNWCYDKGLFKSYTPPIPVISVGNLDVGGAGKSPMTEYLIRLFKDGCQVATLSRGYRRKTKGYVAVSKMRPLTSYQLPSSLTASDQLGDEPAQFKSKFPDVTIAVCGDRVYGIEQLQDNHDLIILDDAYQHRAVKPGISLLLFDFNRLNEPHLLLPAGNLREPFSGRNRADIIIVTKCPEQLSVSEKENIAGIIKPFPHQQLFYTSIAYLPLQNLQAKPADEAITADTTVFLLTGIANPRPLVQHLKTSAAKVIHYNYPDHHRFSLKNISKLAGEFLNWPSKNKLIITTEKDAQRLVEHELLPLVTQLPFFVMPIGVKFLGDGGPQFDQLVTNYVTEYIKHHPVH